MRLVKQYVDIKNVLFDEKTFIKDQTLHISKNELHELVFDKRFSKVDFELAFPGEKCRLSCICDVVQPMYKLGDGQSTFPGVIDEIKRVGNGETVVLRGVGVSEIIDVLMPMNMILDLSGPAVEHSLTLPKLIHVCMLTSPAEGLEKNDYLDAVNTASKKVAKYLAKAAKDCIPDEIEEFTLDIKSSDLNTNLPRVAYIFQIFSHAPYTDTLFYGDGCQKMLPIIVHPNEILDGALLNRDYYQVVNADPTFLYQNHPLILELIKRHGKDLIFAGIIMSNTPHEVADKERNAMLCSNLAKYHLNADCAIITKEGGGHPQVDVAMNCDNCEELGIKTAILLSEFLSAKNPSNELVLFTTKNADAMVTSGCLTDVNYPAMERVVGKTEIPPHTYTSIFNLFEAFTYETKHLLRGSMSQIGNTMFSSLKY